MEKCVTDIFFIGEDISDVRLVPFALARGYAFTVQDCRDLPHSFPCEVHIEDTDNDYRFFLNNDKRTVIKSITVWSTVGNEITLLHLHSVRRCHSLREVQRIVLSKCALYI